MSATRMDRKHRSSVGVVAAGAMVIAAIGFAGSCAVVRELPAAATIAFNGAAPCGGFGLSVVHSAAPPPRLATPAAVGPHAVAAQTRFSACLA
ncbi:hypothetical protein [Streptomyces sp. RPT161]|uniref:hypothetical protein n=1 Tax=Streptomyces sp. RPT161 TaxID=3015993 RepID=UPI0022B8DD95|nr:hypothetical protein [Streptomyces sp. RPT161]